MKAGRMDGAAISTIIRPQPNTKEAAGGRCGPLPVQGKEVRSQESAGQCAPGDAHELSDKGHVALILDESSTAEMAMKTTMSTAMISTCLSSRIF